MNRSLLESVDRLRARGTLTDAQAGHFGRIARGELVSVRLELQVALWIGVTLVAAGTGILVKENLAHLGPVTIGAGIALAAALCLWYVGRAAPAQALHGGEEGAAHPAIMAAAGRLPRAGSGRSPRRPDPRARA